MANNENVNKVVYGDTTIIDITDTTAEASDVAAGEVFYTRSGARSVGTGNYMDKASNPTADDILITDANGQAVDSGVAIGSVARTNQLPGQATETTTGTIKLNPSESVDVNADGQLTVGGRLGQYPNGGGLYYPTSISPENVAPNCLLLTEATTVGLTNNRTFALAGGANVTLKSSAAAGSTTYYVNNTFANRFTCAMAYGGYAAIDQSGAGTICVKVTAVYLESNSSTKERLVPYSGATESNNRIVIETETSVNPDAATTKLRLYGSMKYDSSVHIGQGIGTGGISGKGKLLQVGQSQTALDGNTIMVGNSMFSSKNRVAMFGASHINHVQGAFMGGEGQDSTNGTFVGLGAIGKYSDIKSDTAFAIGNGTSDTARNNLFEVTSDGGVIVPSSTSGSTKKFKITVDDSGTISATEV